MTDDYEKLLGAALWTPRFSQPLLWCFAEPGQFSLSGPLVDSWHDRSGNGNNLPGTGATRPVFSRTGYNADKGAVIFTGSRILQTTSGTIASFLAGTNVPVSVCVTLDLTEGAAREGFAFWDNSAAGPAFVACTTDNSPFALRFRRRSDASVTATSDNGEVTFGPRTIVYTYNGAVVNIYDQGVHTTVDSPNTLVAPLSIDRFSIGPDEVGGTSMFNLREIVVYDYDVGGTVARYYRAWAKRVSGSL